MSVAIAFFPIYLITFWMSCDCLRNNLALTPPMGWTAWGRFRCNVNCKDYPKECISEHLFRQMADRMVEDGYLSAGYEYVLLDDCWSDKKRDRWGRLQPDPKRFPSGLRNLSDYIHSRGLKFGIYGDFGTKTCEGYPGTNYENMAADAASFAEWKVDYVKLDGCYSEPINMEQGYATFGAWLQRTGRPMLYSCSWPSYQLNIGITPNYTTAAILCNVWRNGKDIQDSFYSVRTILNFYAEHQEEFASFAGPGHWNDPDMLIIGNFGLSYEQAKLQMTLWAILAAPLIMSHDLRQVEPNFRNILLNPILIQINQDPLGVQGRRILIDRRKRYEVWTKPVLPFAYGKFSWILAIVNLDDTGLPSEISFPLMYTNFGKFMQCYAFVDLFDVNRPVLIIGQKDLKTRVPPLGIRILLSHPDFEVLRRFSKLWVTLFKPNPRKIDLFIKVMKSKHNSVQIGEIKFLILIK